MPEGDKGYATAEEAAQAALKTALPVSKQFEYAGVVYERDGRFFFSDPKTAGETHSVNVKVQYPKGAKLAGLYHTHPEGKRSSLFSPNDIDVATQLKLPYYMGHYADGAMKVFRPGKTKTRRERRDRQSMHQEWSEGDLLGNAFESLVTTRSGTDGLVAADD